MGALVEVARVAEPSEWFVVFHRESDSRVLSFLAAGEFKHVSAFGYCPGVKVWLVYDVAYTRTWMQVAAGPAVLAEWTRNCEVVKIAHTGKVPRIWGRVGFYCVPAVVNLLGLRCVAITPNQLYRHILRIGGISISASRRPRPSPAPS